MTINRRLFSAGLVTAGLAGTAAVGLLGPKRLQALVTGQAEPLRGLVGGEKMDFLRNREVRALLHSRHRLAIDAKQAGSVEMVTDPALLALKPDFVWPANAVMADMARNADLISRRNQNIFNSPLVIYSWTPVVETLIRVGYVREYQGVYYLLGAKLLIEAALDRVPWKDFGLPEIFGSIIITSTDPARSNSGLSFAALALNLLVGEAAQMDTARPHIDKLVTLFERMGHKESSSGGLWTQYLTEGMGGKALLVGYENQMVEFALRQPETFARLQSGRIRPVVLYPVPTITASHPLLVLNEAADGLIPALTDPAVQDLAWRHHGFRGHEGGAGSGTVGVPGIAASLSGVIGMPDPDVITLLVRRFGGTV